VLRHGDVVRPTTIGLLAALGLTSVSVIGRPVVAIFSTGDELAERTTSPAASQIRDSNGPMLAALVRRAGGAPRLLAVARDNMDSTSWSLDRAAGSDLIVTSGGVSEGEFDLLRRALDAQGQMDFWKVAMRPGKPLAFGRIGETPVIGLPGNPAAAAVCFEQFVRPAIKRMLGRSDLHAPLIRAVLQDQIENPGGRRSFARVVVSRDDTGSWRAQLSGPQGAGMMHSLALANGLLVVPERVELAQPGMAFDVQMSDWTAELGQPGLNQE
jgi:molybdopterin molybdotransferase